MKSILLAGCYAACAAFIAAPCAAQTQDDEPLFDWPYATALGSGVYALGDGSEAQTYRANFSWSLRDAARDRAGLRLLLPVTFGVQNLDDDALPRERGNDGVEHAGFLPGLELEHLVGERWTLRTRAQLGYAKELEGTQEAARLAAVGFRSRVVFENAWGSPALINGVLWTGFDSSSGARDALLRFTTAVELDIRAASWRVRDSPMRWRPHVLKDWYREPPPALAVGGDTTPLPDDEWQIGVAAAREDRFKIWFVTFDAVGIAYRFSDRSSGLRLYFNSVF
jgi:hypothetical protein